MKSTRLAAAALALAALALPGCVLSSSEDVAILPEGTLQATSLLTNTGHVFTFVALEVTCPCTKVRLVVDGWTFGAFPANEPLKVEVPDEVANGTYTLRADALDADVAMSAQRALLIWRPRL